MANRGSIVIRKLGEELTRYQELKARLAGDDVDPQALLDTLEGETELHEACLIVAESVQENEDLAAALAIRIAALQARKSRLEASADTLRNIILMAMERAELETIKGPLATLTKRQTSPALVIEQDETIPAKFWKAGDPKLDRKAVRAALEAGETVPGARMSNGGIGLTIRVK